jgi:hypothetical protein
VNAERVSSGNDVVVALQSNASSERNDALMGYLCVGNAILTFRCQYQL